MVPEGTRLAKGTRLARVTKKFKFGQGYLNVQGWQKEPKGLRLANSS